MRRGAASWGGHVVWVGVFGACAAPPGVQGGATSPATGTAAGLPAVEDCVRVGARLAVENDLPEAWVIPSGAGSLPTGESWAVRGQVLHVRVDAPDVRRDADGGHRVTAIAQVGVNTAAAPFHVELTAPGRWAGVLGCDAFVASEALAWSHALDVTSEAGTAEVAVTVIPAALPFQPSDVRGLPGCALDEAEGLAEVSLAVRERAIQSVSPALEAVRETMAEALRSRVGIMCSARR